MPANTCLGDYQRALEGGGGFLRLYRFSPTEKTVRVQTFSPWLKEYMTGPESQFEFPNQKMAGVVEKSK